MEQWPTQECRQSASMAGQARNKAITAYREVLFGKIFDREPAAAQVG
jgi:hypothetical protein